MISFLSGLLRKGCNGLDNRLPYTDFHNAFLHKVLAIMRTLALTAGTVVSKPLLTQFLLTSPVSATTYLRLPTVGIQKQPLWMPLSTPGSG